MFKSSIKLSHITPFRCLHSTPAVLQTVYKSTTNILTPNLQPPNFAAKSVVILSTVSNLPSITQQAIQLFERDGVQVIVGGVDTVKGSWNGVAEFWTDEVLEVEGTLFEESQNKNWKPIDSKLSFKFGEDYGNEVSLPLANSIFTTGNLVMCFQLKKHDELHDKLLKQLTVKLPNITQFKTVSQDRWVPLYDDDDTNIKRITNFKGNLMKKINKGSAAKYLESNDRLMNIKSKEVEVYVKLIDDSGKVNRYQVIAGGGGWGAKADTIVISPEAVINKGDIVQFYMLTPESKAKAFEVEHFKGLEVECSLPQMGYGDVDGEEKVYDSFSFGSELGFVFDGTNFKAAGDVVSIRPDLTTPSSTVKT